MPRDPRINHINNLIDHYNMSSSSSAFSLKQGLKLLQKIDTLTEQLQHDSQMNPGAANNEFMMWAKQNLLHRELVELSQGQLPDASSKKIIMELSDGEPLIPSVVRWKKDTTPRRTSMTFGALGSRNSQYTEVDSYIHAVKEAEKQQVPGTEPSHELIDAVTALQRKILLMEIAPDKTEMVERFDNLLAHTNQFLNRLVESSPVQMERHRISSSPVIPHHLVSDRGAFEPLVQHLTSSVQEIPIGDFQVRFLGGRNNLNWLATDPETDETFVVRIEPAGEAEPLFITTDYMLVEEIKNSPSLSKFVAQDVTFIPTGSIPSPSGGNRLYNVAVSEFCPRGDLIRALRSEHGSNPATSNDPRNINIMHSVFDMMQQATAMADAFNKDGKIYPDFKAENLLIRDDGTVITADLKTVKRTENGMIIANRLDATPDYEPPECDNPRSLINAEQYMSYQMGLMGYLLMTRLNGDEKYTALDRLKAGEGFDFDNHPIFQTEQGIAARQVIEACMSSDPAQRPSLEHLQERFAELKVLAANQMEHSDAPEPVNQNPELNH